MKTKRLFISTLIAAAAMGLTAYANEAATQTTPVIAETDAPEGADKLLPLADAPAAEDADAEETQDADALELLLADDALVELDEAAAPDELSTETMMREWIARYAAAARFAGIRSVKGTGGGLSSGGAVATAGADFAISAAAPTPSVSVPAAGTVSLADTLTRASAADVSLGSASASDAGTASVATASSASGTGTILPAAFFSTRSVFSAVPAAAASYSLAGSSGVSAYTADDGTSAEDSGTTTNWAGGIDPDTGLPLTDGFATASSATGQGQQTVNTDTIFTITSVSGNLGVANNNAAQGFNTNGHDVKLWTSNATANITINGNFLGDGDVWFARGRWTPNAAGRFAALGEIYVIGGQIWMTAADIFTNNFILGSGTFTEGHDALDRSSFRFNENITFNGTTTILAEGTKLAFEGNRTATFANLTGSGDISVGVYSGSSVLAVTGATNYTGKINLVSGISLNWSADSTFGGLTGTAGTVEAGSKLNIAKAGSDPTSFSGTVGSSTSGVALNLTGSGSQAFTGTNYFSSVSVGSGATLDLSGSTTTLSSSIQNSGTVTVSNSTVFVLADALKNESSDNTWNVITGNTAGITGWGTLVLNNFRKADGKYFSGRSAIDVATAGSVTITDGAYNLFWKSGVTAWDTSTEFDKDSVGSETASTFENYDNVTFSTGDVTVSVSSAVTAGTVNITAGTVMFTTRKVTAQDGFVVENGATLKLATSSSIGGDVTVKTGGTLDLNGKSENLREGGLTSVILAGGKLYGGNSSNVGGGKKQFDGLRLTADSTIEAAADTKFGLVASGWGAVTVDLGGNKLTKIGGGTFELASTTLTAGTIQVDAGTLQVVSDGGSGLNGSAADFIVNENGTLSVQTKSFSAKTLSGSGLVTLSGAGSMTVTTFGNTGTSAAWTGTVRITDKTQPGLSLANYGTSGSAVELQGFSGYFSEQDNGSFAGDLVLTNSTTSGRLYAAQITNGNSNKTLTLSGKISGDGLFSHSGAPTQIYKFTGDVSEFTGTLKSTTATFKFAGTEDQTFSGAIIGDGTTGAKVAKEGSTTLTLNNATTKIADLQISAGTFNLNAGEATLSVATNSLSGGTLNIASAATVKVTITDAVKWDGTTSIDVAGVLALNDGVRISLGANNSLSLSGGRITGAGDAHGALDFFGAHTIRVTEDSEIAAVIRPRNNSLKFNVDDQKKLTVSGAVRYSNGYSDSGTIEKLGAGILDFTNTVAVNSITQSAGTLMLGGAATITTLNQTAGTLNITGEAAKNITTATISNNATEMNVSGTATFGTLTQNAGTLTIGGAATITTLNQTTGTLDITGTAAKNITITTATISNNATAMNISGTATFGTLTQNAGTLTISGKATVTGNYTGSKDTTAYSVLTVNAGGSLSVAGNLTLHNEHNNDTGATMDVFGDVSVRGNFWIARDGKGIVNINNGGTVVANTLTFGQAWTGDTTKSSTVNLESGGVLIAGQILASTSTEGDTPSLNVSALNLKGGILGTSEDSLAINVTSGSGSAAKTLSVVLGTETTSTINTGKYDTTTKKFTNAGAAISIANEISGDGALKKTGAGTLTLSGANTYAGGTTIENGTLVAGSASALGSGTLRAAGSDSVNEVTLRVGETGATSALRLENNISVSADKTLLLESSHTENELSGRISGAGALKLSSGTLSISGSVAGESSVTAAEGTTLKLTSTTAGSFAGNLTIESDAAVSISGKETLKYSGFAADETMTIRVGGVLDLGDKSQRISTGAKLVLAGGTINASATLASDNYGSLDFTDGDNTIVAESGESVINATIRLRDTKYAQWGGSGNLTFQVNDGARLNVAGVINPSVDTETNAGRNIIKTGAGELTLSGANTNFRGDVTIEAGTLIAANSSALGKGTVTAAGSDGVNEVTLNIGASADSALTIANDISVSTGKTLILESANAGNKLTGNIKGADGALKLASGTLEIEGAKTTLKNATVSNGAELKFNGTTTTVSDTKEGIHVDGGGSLVFSSGTATVGRIILNTWYGENVTSEASALAKVSGGVVNVTRTGDHAISIGSGGSTHSHTLTVSGGFLNATAGTTTVGYSSAGTLEVTGGEANLKGVAFSVDNANSDGSLQVSGGRLNVGESGITSGTGSGTKTISFSDATIGALDSWSSAASLGISLTGAVIFDTTKMVASDSGAATADTAGTTITLAGALSGSGTLTKVGAGTLTLTGDNSAFTGNVKLSAGTLEIGHDNALGKGTVTVDANGKLGIAAGVTITEVSGGIVLANGAKIVVDLSDRLSETATFEVTLATNTAISLAAEAALAYSEGGAMDLTDYLDELKGWNKSGWTSSLTYANETLTLTMAIPEPSLFGLLAGVTALGFSMSSRRRRKKA